MRIVRGLFFVLGIAVFIAILYSWVSLLREHFAAPQVSASPTPEPTPSRAPLITGRLDTGKLFNGITVHSALETPAGGDATTERVDPESYVLDLKLRVRVPAANKTIEDLAKVTPQLPGLLPGLASMVMPDPVSPLFAELYNTKVKMLRENLARLDLLLSRHNFYDCQTVLELHHPQTHRKALLLQADMDVDADGSDGDRLPSGTGAPTNFKPFTSFNWPKQTHRPNPYLAPTEERLRRAESELALKTTAPDRKRELRAVIPQLRTEVATLKKFSFLIGTTDPYIVVPGAFTRGRDAVKTGDYAVVVFGNTIYPAVVGDIGPNDKAGEASFRIAKEINAQATPYNRPVSDLKVTYLVFPGTADPSFGPPDLEKLQARCQKFVDEIGGATVPLHHWVSIIPTPTPSPTPSPSPSPTPTSSPGAAASAGPPSPSPASTFAFPVSSATPPL
ncbi:MAG: glycoside hydrolase family 75 protein [Chthoniobacterales bacterium]